MRSEWVIRSCALVALWWAGCAGPATGSGDAAPDQALDGGSLDAAMTLADGGDSGTTSPAVDAGRDAGARPECQWGGAPGSCLSASACAAIAHHTSETGSCATGLGCCIVTPSVADNPPFPAGYKLMTQAQVTPAMTTWAVMILHDPVTYPMFATTTQLFGTLLVLARVEWHPPDFQNSIVHRGVTLYVPK